MAAPRFQGVARLAIVLLRCSFARTQNAGAVSLQAWLDINDVGDEIVGHRLDIDVPTTGSGPNLIILASRNEWHDGTDTEPSIEFGNLYLDLARE